MVFYRVLLMFKVAISCLLPPVLVILQQFASLSPFILWFLLMSILLTFGRGGLPLAGRASTLG